MAIASHTTVTIRDSSYRIRRKAVLGIVLSIAVAPYVIALVGTLNGTELPAPAGLTLPGAAEARLIAAGCAADAGIPLTGRHAFTAEERAAFDRCVERHLGARR
ncbi:hypothetical protein [Noviherbaspirillum galbum]|uniref:Uncharacterized protein n=1 Tax=Noviherbaspirillum galbum TaxID=2709383 RepID=A0A6B3SGQ9_9BURK|nr:hypothetical protein [Noviherbaspirillum galbum]NEX60054.1 hypothetical protein [Noviherbaspirillum galbum]